MQFFTLANFFALAAMAVVGSASPTPVRAELSLCSQYADGIPGACFCCLPVDRRRVRPLARHHRRQDHLLWEHHPQPARSSRCVDHQGHILYLSHTERLRWVPATFTTAVPPASMRPAPSALLPPTTSGSATVQDAVVAATSCPPVEHPSMEGSVIPPVLVPSSCPPCRVR